MKKKLIMLTMAILLMAVTLTAGFIALAVKEIQQDFTAQRLSEASQLLLLEAEHLNPEDLSLLAKTWGNTQGQYRITFIQKDGTVLGDSSVANQTMDNHDRRPEVQQAWTQGQGIHQRRSSTTGVPSLYAAAANPKGNLLVRLALPLNELEAIQVAVVNRSILGILLALSIAMFMVTHLSQKLLRPLDRLRQATQSMAQGNYQIQVSPEADEIGALGQDFNALAQALDQTMSRLQQQRLLLNTVLNHVVTGIVAIDETGNLLLANPPARRLFGFPADIPANTLDSSLLRRDPQLWQLLETTLQTGLSQEADLNRRQTYQVTTALLPMSNKRNAQGVVMAIEDMTRIKKLEALRTEFVANATHELRTPLTSIQGYVETLQSSPWLSPQIQEEILSILEMESQRLSLLIDDMLTLAEIENHRQNTQEEDCYPGDIAREVLQLLQPLANQNQIKLSLDLEENIQIHARRDWLQRLLINLVDNAIKYNRPQGTVRIAIQKLSPQRLRIQIQDTGIGISQEHLQRIFERFYRVDKSRSRQTGGTGLGLAIVKHLVQLYGGTLEVDSVLGQGTLFSIELPAI